MTLFHPPNSMTCARHPLHSLPCVMCMAEEAPGPVVPARSGDGETPPLGLGLHQTVEISYVVDGYVAVLVDDATGGVIRRSETQPTPHAALKSLLGEAVPAAIPPAPQTEPRCTATKLCEGHEAECQRQIGHAGPHVNGDLAWEDPQPAPFAICACGHTRISHPFGLSQALVFDGRCELCPCEQFDARPSGETPNG